MSKLAELLFNNSHVDEAEKLFREALSRHQQVAGYNKNIKDLLVSLARLLKFKVRQPSTPLHARCMLAPWCTVTLKRVLSPYLGEYFC